MTRITGTSPSSRRSMNAVVIPAATDTTSWSADTAGAISPSSRFMSWGLTASSRVPASFAAEAASVTRTPYRSRSSAARSSRRTAATSADGGRPARSSPDSRASPILPVPIIAIMRRALGLRPERAQEEGQVAGPFRQPADQVGVPVAAVGDVHAHLRTGIGQPALLGGADPVQHLVLEAIRGPPGQQGE